MAKSTIRSAVAAIHREQRAQVKGLKPTLSKAGVRKRRRRTARLRIRG